MPDNFGYFLGVLLAGVVPTVELTILSVALATAIAFVLGVTGLHRWVVVRTVVRTYVEFWRGTSELVQLFWVYFAVPIVFGVQFEPFVVGLLVIGFNGGAYGSEIVRGAVKSVDKAQFEACVALNLSRRQRMMRVILPQAIPEMLPSFNNLYIGMLKGTALVSLINIPDITYQGQQILGTTFPGQTPLIYAMMFGLYLALAGIITVIMRALERAAARKVGKRSSRRSTSVNARRALLVGGA